MTTSESSSRRLPDNSTTTSKQTTMSTTTATTTTSSSTPTMAISTTANFLARYPFLNDCDDHPTTGEVKSDELTNNDHDESSTYDYSRPAANTSDEVRVLKAVIVYFPIELSESFAQEFRWFYRSWIEMMSHEATSWRTDLVVFVHNANENGDDEKMNEINSTRRLFDSLNCSFLNRRTSSEGNFRGLLLERFK